MKKFDTEVHLSREMGLMDATLIGVGAMIGAGIFVLIGIAAGVAGPALIVTFSLNGIVALLTAFSYAELGSCYHDAGGGYLWVKEGLPKWNGFISGWMSWFAHAVACSLYALGFGAYFDLVLREFNVVMPQWGFLSPQKILAAMTAVLFAYVNFRGASETGKVGNIVTLAKIAILLVFIGFGINLIINRPDWQEAFTPFFAHGWGGVFKAMGLTFIAFQGFEVISQCSEEIKNPKKNIPRAIFLSLIIVVPIYLLVAITALGAVKPGGGITPWDYLASHKETALVEVAKTFFVGGGIMLLIGGIISTMSALNATIYSSSRVAYAMGKDRNFPTFFSKVHKKNFTPHLSIIFSLFIVVIMAISLPIEDVASAADIMFLLLFLQVNITLIRLRKKRPDLDRGFFTPFFPYLSILGIMMLLFLAVYMFNYSPTAWIVTGVWVTIGLVTYKSYAANREIEHVRKVKSLERLEKKEYRVLVPLANKKTASSLAHIANAIAKKSNAQIIFLHVNEVKEGSPLASQLSDNERAKPLFDSANQVAEEEGVPARSILNVSHRISQGIVNTAEEEECNFIIVGREKKPDFFERFFSSIIDSVIQKFPGEVAVLHGAFKREQIKTILIPFTIDIHAMLATEIAPALLNYFNCKIRILLVYPPETTQREREERENKIQELIKENSIPAEVKIIKNTDILQAIIKESKRADLVLMGGKTGDFLELLFGRSLAQEITEQSACPVLWVKEYEEREPLWKLLLKSPKQIGVENG
ncbi:MAG: amino acid permease [Ignavibacteriaceae bacterium]|jgi:amino acid transporter|nr:amino acid permease [Ignavibacteriaceae bacterium]MCW8822520.1 amino acid permease [Ignavibacteriaceae bacterium]